jgi:hypothetical protein
MTERYWTPSAPFEVWDHIVTDTEGDEAGRFACATVEVTWSTYKRGPWNGYVRFAKRPVREQGYDGILTYVPVHGGITYANADGKGMVYGFDCAHLGDEPDGDNWEQVNNYEWMRGECERMGMGVLLAATVEARYLLAPSSEEKGEIIDEYHRACALWGGGDFELTENFGAMLRVLGGDL